MYRIRILDSATRELSQLDHAGGRRIIACIRWLAAHLDELKLERLTRDLEGLYKFRVGDYRIIYEVLHAEQTIVIHAMGHRREIYRKR